MAAALDGRLFRPTTMAVPLLLVGLRAAVLDERRVLLLVSAGLLFLRDDLLAAVALALVGWSTLSRESRRFGDVTVYRRAPLG